MILIIFSVQCSAQRLCSAPLESIFLQQRDLSLFHILVSDINVEMKLYR